MTDLHPTSEAVISDLPHPEAGRDYGGNEPAGSVCHSVSRQRTGAAATHLVSASDEAAHDLFERNWRRRGVLPGRQQRWALSR